MKKTSAIKNIIYAFIMQISNLILSFVTSPYLSEVLGAGQLGRVNFISAFASWFSVLSIFGVSTYGVRAISKTRDDKEALSKCFSELFAIRLVFTLISLILFGISILSVSKINQEIELALLQCIILAINILSIDWFFQGLEDYGFIAIRNLIYKVLSVVLVFVCIKNQNDTIKYAIIMAASSLTVLFNIPYIKRRVKITFKGLNLKQHFSPLCYFFITSMLLNIYMMIDQNLLGFFKDDKDVGLLVRARMFLNVSMTLTSSINSALLPRAIKKFETDKDDYNRFLSFSANSMMYFAVPISIGMILISKYLLTLIGSSEFLEAERTLQILSASIITVVMGGFNYNQRIMPNKKEKMGIYICIVTASVSLLLNLLLISRWGIVGCAISYLVAEIIGNTVWFIYMNKIDGFKVLFKLSNLKYLIGGLVMGGVIMFIQYFLTAITWINFMIVVFSGIIVYTTFMLLIKEEISCFAYNKVKTFFNKKRNIEK